MGFFMNLAQSILNMLSSLWGSMCNIAATIMNSTFGAFTGRMFETQEAGLLLWGGLGLVGGILLAAKIGFFGKYN